MKLDRKTSITVPLARFVGSSLACVLDSSYSFVLEVRFDLWSFILLNETKQDVIVAMPCSLSAALRGAEP